MLSDDVFVHFFQCVGGLVGVKAFQERGGESSFEKTPFDDGVFVRPLLDHFCFNWIVWEISFLDVCIDRLHPRLLGGFSYRHYYLCVHPITRSLQCLLYKGVVYPRQSGTWQFVYTCPPFCFALMGCAQILRSQSCQSFLWLLPSIFAAAHLSLVFRVLIKIQAIVNPFLLKLLERQGLKLGRVLLSRPHTLSSYWWQRIHIGGITRPPVLMYFWEWFMRTPSLVLEDSSLNTTHIKVGGVNSAWKFVNVCAFNAFFSSNIISNSDSSIDHLVILSVKSGRNKTCFSSWSVLTTIGWAKKYLNNFLETTIRASTTFSIFWYRVSGPAKAFEQKYTGLWLVPISLTRKVLNASSEMAKYIKKVSPAMGLNKTEGCDRMPFSLLSVSSHYGVHSKFASFLRSLRKGKAC